MKIEIKHRISGNILFSFETSRLKLALEVAVERGVDLEGAYLKGAYLKGAYLEGAYLKGADLEGAYLEGAYLKGADLEGANLEGAYLKGAYLEGANLKGAYLKGAYLKGADLEGAYLNNIKADFFKVLDAAPQEVEGLRKKMVEGKINGSAYQGECACLVGSIANVKGCQYDEIKGLAPNAERPAERWFLMFREGHTPERHNGMKITLGWLDEWTEKNKAKVAA